MSDTCTDCGLPGAVIHSNVNSYGPLRFCDGCAMYHAGQAAAQVEGVSAEAARKAFEAYVMKPGPWPAHGVFSYPALYQAIGAMAREAESP